MRNVITLNGRASTEITGLLVQELPAISKPQMRVNLEQIDGRDGDIITQLGYAAYDREATIGLHGNYNIDDVIAFFNDSGDAIFSNEPERRYNYTIVDRIDYERLVRFRTAKVNFHVQPYKRAVSESAVTGYGRSSNAQVTNHGNVIARPTITISGRGTITLYIVKSSVMEEILKVSLSDSTTESIAIDCEAMEATDGQGNLWNRRVNGDYDNMILDPGVNIIAWSTTGGGNTAPNVYINNYSRWI